jgi:large subunit ribosomal protein L25
MASFVTIEAEARERAGKGAARATRRQGRIPAVIYGAKQAPTLISLEPKAVLREIHKSGWRSRLYEVTVGGQTSRALLREVQLHPVTDKPEHVDFQRLAPGEKIRVAVTVIFHNEATSPGLKRGGMLNVVRHSVECYVDPDNVPEHFDADLGDLDINDNIRWSNLKGAEGIRATISDRDFVVATVVTPSKLPDAPVEAAAAAPVAAAKAPAKGAAPAKAAAPKPAAKKK